MYSDPLARGGSGIDFVSVVFRVAVRAVSGPKKLFSIKNNNFLIKKIIICSHRVESLAVSLHVKCYFVGAKRKIKRKARAILERKLNEGVPSICTNNKILVF